MKRSLRLQLTLGLLACLAGAAQARAEKLNDIIRLTRCLQCISDSCDDHGQVISNQTDSPNRLASDPDMAITNKDTGQKIQIFPIRSDVLIVTASPPARRPIAHKGVFPGFFLYRNGTSYFCPTSQITTPGPSNLYGDVFKIEVPLIAYSGEVVETVERGIKFTKNLKDGSVASMWGEQTKDLKKSTRTLSCVEDGDFTEKKAANNPLFVLADTIRYALPAAAEGVVASKFPFMRDHFLSSTRAACGRADLPFPTVLRPPLYDAWAKVEAKPRSSFEKLILPKEDQQPVK